MADGFLDEVRRLAAGPPLSRTAAQALGYRELLAHLAAGERRSTTRSTWPSAAPAGSPAASGPGSAATPASPGSTPAGPEDAAADVLAPPPTSGTDPAPDGSR